MKKIKLKFRSEILERSKKIIPGGTMLFSKNPDLYLPEKWLPFFKSKRC